MHVRVTTEQFDALIKQQQKGLVLVLYTVGDHPIRDDEDKLTYKELVTAILVSTAAGWLPVIVDHLHENEIVKMATITPVRVTEIAG